MTSSTGPSVCPSPGLPRPESLDPRRCAILVPFATHISPRCDAALAELQRRGYSVIRVGGYAAIDQGRNQMATDALRDGYEETFWIDADIAFHPDAVDRLRADRLPIVSGIYPRKGVRAIAAETLPGTAELVVGKGGGLTEILYAGAGFLLVRREVYTTIQERLALPVCNQQFGSSMVPFFQPMVLAEPVLEKGTGTQHRETGTGTFPRNGPAGAAQERSQSPFPGPSGAEQEGSQSPFPGHRYLAEDYAFCERARQCGFKIMADTTIRLGHLGEYVYGWEDAGLDRPQFETFVFRFAEENGRRG